MGRFSRLFSRKSEAEQAASAEGKSSAQDKTAPQPGVARGEAGQAQVKSQLGGSPGQDFGLQFIFESGEVKTFQSLPITIGRSEQNDIILGDPTVSARHVRVYYDEHIKDICIQDVDSLNGLFINDQPTRRNILLDGMKIRLGKVNLVFRDTGYIHPGTG